MHDVTEDNFECLVGLQKVVEEPCYLAVTCLLEHLSNTHILDNLKDNGYLFIETLIVENIYLF